MSNPTVKCGDCAHFVRDGKCGFNVAEEARKEGRPWTYAPFWVWSDCYSDKEQVRASVTSACPTFKAKVAPDAVRVLPTLDEIQDENFTGGMRTEDYLAKLYSEGTS